MQINHTVKCTIFIYLYVCVYVHIHSVASSLCSYIFLHFFFFFLLLLFFHGHDHLHLLHLLFFTFFFLPTVDIAPNLHSANTKTFLIPDIKVYEYYIICHISHKLQKHLK